MYVCIYDISRPRVNFSNRSGGWSTPRPGHFTPGIGPRRPLYRRLRGPRTRSGHMLKISSPPVLEARAIHPIASRYTDYAIPATSLP